MYKAIVRRTVRAGFRSLSMGDYERRRTALVLDTMELDKVRNLVEEVL